MKRGVVLVVVVVVVVVREFVAALTRNTGYAVDSS